MKSYKIATLLTTVMLAASCSGWLDVDPKTEVKSDKMFESESGFKDAIIGSYILLTNNSLYGRELTMGFLDIVAQQFSVKQGADSYFYIRNSFDYADRGSNIINAAWQKMYETIANVNNILENIDAKRDMLHPTVYAILKGEALGLRGFMHFDLLRMFGWGDLENHPENLDKMSIPYSFRYNKEIARQYTVREALDFAMQDLEAASELLEGYDPWSPAIKDDDYVLPNDDKFFTNRMTRFNYWAVQATMARIYMWRAEYDKALAVVENFITNRTLIPGLTWISDGSINSPAEADRDLTFSSEHIFRLDVHDLYKGLQDLIDPAFNAPNENARLFYHTAEYAETLYEIADHIGDSDYRFTRLYNKPNSTYSLRKFFDFEGYNYANRMPVIRMSEMYYMGAECLNRQGKGKEAIEYLNTVRRNRGISDTQMLPEGLDQQRITQEIEKEWRKEFLGEGQMFYFYKRLGYSKIPNSNVNADEKVYVLPIPEDEVNAGGREENKTQTEE